MSGSGIIFFYAMGNYLFCARCVCRAFQLSPQCLARQRAVRRAESQTAIIEMTKAQVETERLGEYVIMPIGCEQSFRVR